MTDFRGIPLNFSRFDDHSVKIEPRSPLSPGEYAFLAVTVATDPYAAQNQTLYYCFGVDYGSEASNDASAPPAAVPQVASTPIAPPETPLAPIAPPPPPPDPVVETKSIEVGQTKAQVEAILGKPDTTAKVGTKEIYQYKDLKVTFVNGKMADAQ